ncbi:hypothetical protein, partial [Falsiroseomonas sp.]|uniref:hypothetical protein n=1 Tax=Falsiroseomonas sp. TaxID=2870721 RepID=UPI00271B25E6
MMVKALTGFGAAGAMFAAGFAPAMAAPVTVPATSHAALAALAWSPGDERANQYRGGYRDHRGYRRGGISGGDILAGALIIGGIAAVASAASNANRRGPVVNQRYNYNDDVRSAANQCGAAAAAQSGFGSRIESIDNVVREGNGWRVEVLVGGRGGAVDSFSCGISYGRIDYVQFNRAGGYAPGGGGYGQQVPGYAPGAGGY